MVWLWFGARLASDEVLQIGEPETRRRGIVPAGSKEVAVNSRKRSSMMQVCMTRHRSGCEVSSNTGSSKVYVCVTQLISPVLRRAEVECHSE